MRRWYLDTSAALKLIQQEPESAVLAAAIDEEQPDLVAGVLLVTELRRAVHRNPALRQELVTDLLRGISLYEMPPSVFHEAGLLPGEHMRSLGALHLAAAVSIGVDYVVTYDARMAAQARELGLEVLAPRPE